MKTAHDLPKAQRFKSYMYVTSESFLKFFNEAKINDGSWAPLKQKGPE